MSNRPTIRRVTDEWSFCFFCGEEAKLEVEHSGPREGLITEVCIDCARALGHASIGNRTWTPKEA